MGRLDRAHPGWLRESENRDESPTPFVCPSCEQRLERPVRESPRPLDCPRVPDRVSERQHHRQLSAALRRLDLEHERLRFADGRLRPRRERPASHPEAELEGDGVPATSSWAVNDV